MAQILSPGVYVTEQEVTGYVPAVSTTIAIFVGEFKWGPAFDITTVTNEQVLVSRFSTPTDDNFRDWFSARNFLDYSINLKMVRAVNPATSNNATSSGTPIYIPNQAFYTQNYHSGEGTVGNWAARYPGDLGNSLAVSFCSPGQGFSNAMTSTVTANAGNAILTFSGNTWTDTGRPLQVGDYVRINSTGDWLDVISINNFGNTVTVSADSTSEVPTAVANTVQAKWRYADFFTDRPRTSENAAELGGANDECHVVVVDRFAKFSARANTVLERFAFMSLASDIKNDDGTSAYVRDLISQRSAYIYWMDNNASGTNWGNTAQGTNFTLVNKPEYANLSGGADGTITEGNIITGYDLFQDKETVDFTLAITGDHASATKLYVLDSLVGTRRDAVAFIAPSEDTVVFNDGNESEDNQTYRDLFPSTSYGFYVDNWKYQYDKYSDVYRWLPLDADIAGLVARTAADRDAWWSPAGFNRGQLKNVAKLAWKATQADRDDMYKKGINSAIKFNNESPVLYGDRTMLTRPSPFDRINVRMLFIVMEKAISLAARYSLFEFNDAITRAQFVQMVSPYLRDIQGRRGIIKYAVIADETNNTGEVIARNEFVGDIKVLPNYSINAIQLNFFAVGPNVTFDVFSIAPDF